MSPPGKQELHDSGSYHPLLSEEQDGFGHRPSRQRRSFIWHSMIHLALLAANTTFILAGYHWWYGARDCHQPLIYSPARDSVRYEKVSVGGNLEHRNEFMGPPRPELDEAWHKLLQNFNIRLPEDTMKRINRTTIQLSDGSGDYYGTLNVYHHLHCLKSIHHHIYRDHYNTSEGPRPDDDPIHVDHCLEDMRKMLMCHPDLSILTFNWVPGHKMPFPNFNIDHECVNWDLLDAWAGERAFEFSNKSLLVRPPGLPL